MNTLGYIARKNARARLATQGHAMTPDDRLDARLAAINAADTTELTRYAEHRALWCLNYDIIRMAS